MNQLKSQAAIQKWHPIGISSPVQRWWPPWRLEVMEVEELVVEVVAIEVKPALGRLGKGFKRLQQKDGLFCCLIF